MNHSRALLMLAVVSATFTLCCLITGCNAPAWITDAESLLPIIGSSITSVLSFIAAFTGNAALAGVLGKISTIIADVGNGLTDLDKMVQEYKANPSDTLYQKITAAASDIRENLKQILSDTGLPASLAAKVQAWAQIALTQLEGWMGVLPALHQAAKSNTLHAMAALKPADDRILPPAELKAAFNRIWEPTGDPNLDKALATVPRL